MRRASPSFAAARGLVQDLYYRWSKDFSMRGSEKRWAVNDAELAGLERRCHLGSTVNPRLFGMSVHLRIK